MSDDLRGDAIVMARIGKPHGLRGEVTVQLHTDEPEKRFAVGTPVDTQAPPGSGVPRQLTIRSTRVHNGVWLLGFEEIPDRTGAEGLRGTRLVLGPDTEAGGVQGQVDGQDGEQGWYESDLAGLEVRDAGGHVLGVVTGLEVGSHQDRLVIELTDGATAYLPFVEQLVPVVAEDHLVVEAPPGLFDLYREG